MKKYFLNILSLLLLCKIGYAQNIISERVTGILHYAAVDTGGFIDTTYFSYSSNRGSEFDFNNMSFDFTNYYSTMVLTGYYDYSLRVKPDTGIYLSVTSSPTGIYINNTYIYTSDNSVTLYRSQDQSGYDAEIYYYYNTQGLQTKAISLSFSNGTFDTIGKNTSSYDGQNNVIADSSYAYSLGVPSFNPIFATNYTYNSNHQIMHEGNYSNTSAILGWVTTISRDYDFYSNGKLKSITTYTGDTLGLQRIDSFAYNGTTAFITTQTTWWYNPYTSSWNGGTQSVRHLNGNNLPDTVYAMEYNLLLNKWDTTSKTAYIYTAYNNPQYAYEFGKDVDYQDSLMYVTHYHYELYNTTAVKDIPSQLEKMTLYPNPTSDELNLTWNNANGKRNLIEITDVSGKKHMAVSLLWNVPTEKIHIGNLAAGNYYLTVRNEKGVLIFRQALVKW